jgi:four helix bundle protein
MDKIITITERTKIFSLRIIKAYGWLKKQNDECRLIGKQLFRSATSTGANVWEGEFGQSKKDKISKLEISRKECIETQYWLTLLIESNLVSKDKFQPLLNEAIEIGKILTTSIKTLKNSL